MKILKVIHGYPMRYNAGSEVYSQTLCHELAKCHEVHVFTREEDAFAPDFRLRVEHDEDDPRIDVHIVNNPRLKDRYRAEGIDQRFAEVLALLKPDVVHIGHLSHLSTSLVQVASARGIPIVFTLHDYWLMCPRGQFMQMFPDDPEDLWAACDGQEDRKCALRCYSRYFSGSPEEFDKDASYWTDWVARRMRHMRKMSEMVDVFIAPAQYLLRRYRDDFGLPERKLHFLDYGFARERLQGRSRTPGEPFTFGYIGTHIPAKGIHHLVQAFGRLDGDVRLRIWGRHRGQDSESLRCMTAALPAGISDRVEWLPEYKNREIVRDVFNRCDAIVVPSVWVENSPLVIHEAQQARVPVITADAGGMGEYVHHGINGLLYEHRSVSGLAEQMQRFVDDPGLAERLGGRGYLFSESGDIPGVEGHVRDIVHIYEKAIQRKAPISARPRRGPWRITFDTNPDTCNLRCVMCEEHSPHSNLQAQRISDGRPRRLMPFETIRSVVAETAPHDLTEIIPSTMGEPLLYEHFEGILDLCRQYGLKLNLTTNGTFPRYGAKEWAKKIVPVASDIKISWNGAAKATQEMIMLGSSWERGIDNLRDLVMVRDDLARSGGNWCRLTLQLTFLESNVEELADMVRMAVSLGLDRVKGHHVWAHFPSIECQSMRRDRESIERWNQAVFEVQKIATEQFLPNGNRILLENFYMLDPTATEDLAPEGPCPFLGQEAWVSAEGRFDPCCAPDALRRTLGDFGNLNEQSFMEIWNGDAYDELIATYRSRRLCVGCNMRKPVKVKAL